MKNKYYLFLLVVFLFLKNNYLCSQGQYNDVIYDHIRYLDCSFINKQIFLDFKTNSYDTLSYKTPKSEPKLWAARLLIGKQGSGVDRSGILIQVEGKQNVFKEDWMFSRGVTAVYRQRLVNDCCYIKDIYLEKLTNDSVFLKANLYFSENNFNSIRFKVNKNKIRGFLHINYAKYYPPRVNNIPSLPSPEGTPCSTYYELGLTEKWTCQEVTTTEEPEGNWSTTPTKMYYGTSESSCDIIRKCATTLPTDEGYIWSEEKPSLEGK